MRNRLIITIDHTGTFVDVHRSPGIPPDSPAEAQMWTTFFRVICELIAAKASTNPFITNAIEHLDLTEPRKPVNHD